MKHFKFFLMYLGILMLIMHVSANSQWSTDPSVNTPVCIAAGEQRNHAIAYVGSGNTVIAWLDKSGSVARIYAQKYNATGEPMWGTTNILVFGMDEKGYRPPHVITDGSGGVFIAAWADTAASLCRFIMAQRITGNGEKPWGEKGRVIFRPSCCDDCGTSLVGMVSDYKNGALILYSNDYMWQQVNSYYYLVRIDQNGVKTWSSSSLLLYWLGGREIILTDDGRGGAIIVWMDTDYYEYSTIYATIIDESRQYFTQQVICDHDSLQEAPIVVSDGTGGGIIAWFDKRSIHGNKEIYAQRIDQNCDRQWPENGILIAESNPHRSARNSIKAATVETGGAVFTWESHGWNQHDLVIDLKAKMLDVNSNKKWGNDGLVWNITLENPVDRLNEYAVINDLSDNFIVSWIIKYEDAVRNIIAKKIDFNGNLLWGDEKFICDNINSFAEELRLVPDGAGGGIMAWVDQRNGNKDIYTQQINEDGELGISKYKTSDILTEVGSLEIPVNTGLKVQASGDYAYLTDYDGAFFVVDVQSKTNPSHRGSISNVMGKNIHDMWYADGYAYTTHRYGGVAMIDVSDRDNPSVVSTAPTNYSHCGITSVGNYLFVGDHSSGASPGGLRIFDISGGTLSEIGTFLAELDGRRLVVTSDGKYVYQAGAADDWPPCEAIIYDVTNKASPDTIATFNHGYMGHWMLLSEDENTLFMPVAYGETNPVQELQVWDISNRENPTLISTFTDAIGSCLALGPGNLLFMSDWTNIYILDRSNLNSVQLLETLQGIGGWLSADGNYLYVGWGSSAPFKLRIFEINGTSGPTLSVNPTTLDFGSTITSLTFDISNTGSGTMNWNVAENPDKPWITSIYPTSGTGDRTVTVRVNCGKVNGTSDTGTITVSSNGGNQDVTVLITKEIVDFPENRVNDDDQGDDQDVPAIAVAPDASFVIAWEDKRNEQSNIYAQLFDANGAKSGNNFKVNDVPGGYSPLSPDIDIFNDGNFVIAWAASDSILAQLYDSYGSKFGNNFKVGGVEDPYMESVKEPSVGCLMDGSFITVWIYKEDTGGGEHAWDVYGQKCNQIEAPVGNKFQVNDYTFEHNLSSVSLSPSISISTNGSFVITWTTQDYIYAQRYDANGNKIGNNFIVHESTGPYTQYYFPFRSPDVAMNDDGSFIIVWAYYFYETEYTYDFYGQLYDNAGNQQGDEFKINDLTTNNELMYCGGCSDISVSALGNGEFVVTWPDYRNGNNDIYAQRYNSDGTPAGNNYRVNQDGGEADQISPDVVYTNNNIYYVWQDNRIPCQGWDIFYRVETTECSAPFVAAPDISGGTGTHVFVEIIIEDNPTPIDAFGLKLSFDTNMLTYVGAEKCDLSTPFDFFDASEGPTGTVTIGAFHTSAILANSSGCIAKLQFEVTCAGCSEGDKSLLHIHNLMDDLVGLNICDGSFTYMSCLLGDVNMDLAISPGDALCAFRIYLSGGIPPEGECDNVCALYASDANCDGPVSPGDALIIFRAYLDGLQPPLECPPALTVSKTASDLELSLTHEEGIPGEEVTMPIKLNNPDGLDAFGFDLGYPDELLSFVKVSSTDLTKDWQVVNGKENVPGTVTIGGFNPKAICKTKSDVLLTVTLKAKQETEGYGDLWLFNLTDDLAEAEINSGGYSTIVNGVRKISDSDIPKTFALEQNYPNPFNLETEIMYQLPEAIYVELTIYNSLGHRVRTLVSRNQSAGRYAACWDGRDELGNVITSGIYIYRIRTSTFNDVKKMLLVK